MEAWKIELYYGNVIDYHELYHYGTKGQKWGERHWQNPDGTFNEAGKQRYFGKGSGENYHSVKSGGSGKTSSKSDDKTRKEKWHLTDNQKKALKIGAAVAGTALAVYGAYKLNEFIGDKNYQRNMEAAHEFVNGLQKSYMKENRYANLSGVADAQKFISENNKKFESAYDKVYSSVSRKGKFDPKKLDIYSMKSNSFYDSDAFKKELFRPESFKGSAKTAENYGGY